MKMANVIKRIFLNIYAIGVVLIGCLISTYILFMRLIYKRLPRDLSIDLSTTLLYIYVGILSMFLFSLSYTIYKAFFYQERADRIDYLRYIRPLMSFWNHCLIQFDYFIKSHIENSWDITVAIGLYLYNKYSHKHMVFSIVLFCIIPKVIVVCAFLIDIFLYHKFNYFYKLSYLLIIPLIFNYLIYSLHDLSITNIIKMSEEIVIKDDTGSKLLPIEASFRMFREKHTYFEFEPTPEFEYIYRFCNEEQTLDGFLYYVKIYSKLHNIFDLTMNIGYIKERIIPYPNIMIYLLYSIGWSYIIWYGTGSIDVLIVPLDNIDPFSGLYIDKYEYG